MSTTAGRVFTGLTRSALSRGIFNHHGTSTVRLNSVRSLAVSLQRTAKSADDEEEVKSEPIKFSTSKASHKSWRVEGSMGSQYQRPWWKVLPVSLFGMIFLLWCALRKESDIDSKLEENLYERLPGLLSDGEEADDSS
ncbi:ubiquinol-cytochrome c reductase complex assembly factor 4 isoform X2 [Sparus aurata]|uniref:ubiquinol-cytochrome c reductase complex assembly factor 4 isoform X2 n=1 Tax=Sparus aurata TaxID=8175 RepID=UPI0011C1B53C|nr:protein CCSMST1 isoform X2 [Sparus aurata]